MRAAALKEAFIIDRTGKTKGVILDFKEYSRLKMLEKVIDPGQVWFWTKKWQAKERRADRALKKGRIKVFDSMKELIRELKD